MYSYTCNMDEEGHILTELSSLDDLVLPLSRSARLKVSLTGTLVTKV